MTKDQIWFETFFTTFWEGKSCEDSGKLLLNLIKEDKQTVEKAIYATEARLSEFSKKNFHLDVQEIVNEMYEDWTFNQDQSWYCVRHVSGFQNHNRMVKLCPEWDTDYGKVVFWVICSFEDETTDRRFATSWSKIKEIIFEFANLNMISYDFDGKS